MRQHALDGLDVQHGLHRHAGLLEPRALRLDGGGVGAHVRDARAAATDDASISRSSAMGDEEEGVRRGRARAARTGGTRGKTCWPQCVAPAASGAVDAVFYGPGGARVGAFAAARRAALQASKERGV